MRIRALVALAWLVTLAVPVAVGAQGGASLSAASGSGDPGDTGIGIPITLNSDAGIAVSGLNFDLGYDTGRLAVSNVTIGAAASSAGKSLSWSQPSAGTVRVIVFGLNQDAIPDGVVANVTFNVVASAAPGTSNLDLHNAAATSPSGGAVPLSLSDGSFTVNAPPPTATSSPTAIASATASATPSFTNTPGASATPSATSTRTPTRTATRTNTSGPSPTASRTPSRTPTSPPGAATATRMVTQTVTATVGPTSTLATTAPGDILVTSSPSASPTQDSAIGEGPVGAIPPEIETAAVATGTALAQLEEAVAATSTALAIANPPPSRPALPRTSTLVLIGLALTIVIGIAAAAAVVFLRRRTGE